MAEYEGEVERKICVQRRLLDSGLRSTGTGNRQLSVSKEELEWSSDEDLESTHIKEEQEELCIDKEEAHLQALQEGDIIEFTFSPATVKNEDDEEEPESSQLHQRHFKENREDCQGPELARNLCPDGHLGTLGEGHASELSVKTELKEEKDEPQSGLNTKNSLLPAVNGTSCTNEKKPFGCSECDKRFGFNFQLTRHMLIHTREKPSCSVCCKTFSQNAYLKSHERTHTGEKPFHCVACGETFSQKAYLKLHERTHTGEKPFHCAACGKNFSSKKMLKRHVKSHAGEKPYSCSECGYSFDRRGELLRHMVVHTGEKPFKCVECGKRFTQKINLERHTRTHTGEKPFSCSQCGKRFGRKEEVQRHMLVHKGDKPFICYDCGH